jgi:PAS domain S-box-containing protein
MDEKYEDLRNWYLARLRRLFIQQSYGQMLTPAALVEADREIVEKLIAQKSLQSGAKSVIGDQPSLPDAPVQRTFQRPLLGLAIGESVVVGIAIALIWNGAQSEAATLLMVMLIAFLVTAIFLWRALQNSIVEPLNNIEVNARRAAGPEVGARGNDPASSNQLDRLALLFNRTVGALTQSLEREKAIADFSQQLVCSIDREGTILAISPSVSSLLGYSVRQLVGQSLAKIVGSQGMEMFQAFLKGAGGDQAAAEFDTRAVTMQKTVLDLHWNIEWSSSKQALFCTADNVTAEKKVERLKQEFVNMITHDIKAPLAAMLGRCEILLSERTGSLDPKVISSLETMYTTGEKLMFLVNGLLDVEKFESGQLRLDTAPSEAASVVEAACETVRPLCEKKGIQLRSDLEAITVTMDRQRISQVLVNLLSNACKFSPQDSTIDVQLKRQGNEALFVVVDAGRGIPADAQVLIFDRFRQLELDDQVTHKGSGLGLSICKALVESHGGTIGVDSEAGSGSRFWFKLPVGARD